MKQENKSSLLISIVLNNIYELLVIVSPIITAPYVHRIIGTAGIGIYSYTHSIVTYFVLVSGLGTVAYGKRAIAIRRDNPEEYSRAFYEIELLSIVVSAICLVIWALLCISYREYTRYLVPHTLLIISTLFNISWFYAGLEEFKFTVVIDSITKILSVISTFLFVKNEDNLIQYMYILSASQLFGNVSAWFFLRRFLVKTKIKYDSLLNHLKETLVYFVPAIATTLYGIIDKTLIGLITNDNSQNGYYEAATKIINITKAISFAGINGVVSSRMSYLFSQKKTDDIKLYSNTSLEIEMFLSIGCAFGIAGVAKTFIPFFFGEEFVPTVNLLYIFVPIIPILAISNLVGSLYYIPAGKRSLSAGFLIGGTVANLIMNLALIPHYNMYGAAVASVLAEVIITYLYIKHCDGFLPFTEIWKCIWKKMIAGFLMMLITYIFNMFNINSFVRVFMQLVVGVIIYSLTLLLLKDKSAVIFTDFLIEKMKKMLPNCNNKLNIDN